MPILEEAVAAKNRVLIAPPNMCSFSTQGMEVDVSDGYIATKDVAVINACLESGFMEATDPKQKERVRRLMADKLKRETFKRAKDNGDDDTIAMDKAHMALVEAGFVEAPSEDEEPEETAGEEQPVSRKKPKAKAS